MTKVQQQKKAKFNNEGLAAQKRYIQQENKQ